jgi:hypothetical protein
MVSIKTIAIAMPSAGAAQGDRRRRGDPRLPRTPDPPAGRVLDQDVAPIFD